MKLYFGGVLVLALSLLWCPMAHADYEMDKNKRAMDAVDRALNKFTKDPGIFDGRAIVGGVSASAALQHAKLCKKGAEAYSKYMRRLTVKGKATARAKGIAARFKFYRPWCVALGNATDSHVQLLRNEEAAAAGAKNATIANCNALYSSARNALDSSSGLYFVLETWSGARVPGEVQGVAEFRKQVDALAPVCEKFSGTNESCHRHGRMLSSATNSIFYQGDICKLAGNPNKTMTDVAMRYLKTYVQHRRKEMPTTESFAREEGWIEESSVVSYHSMFVLSEASKKQAMEHISEVFVAARVPQPKDLSVVWQGKQDYLSALKAAVDETAPRWKLRYGKCKGYACSLAKRAIKKTHRGADVKGVFQREWKISKNGLGVPLQRSLAVFALYQIKGEPHCQLRSMTAIEPYKGRGRYKRARRVRWEYLRFQKC